MIKIKKASCTACPMNCVSKQNSYCEKTERLSVALAALHFGEEPPLVGGKGSGTLFLSGCNMKCPFCQNWQISRGIIRTEMDIDDLARLMLSVEEKGAANINFVTGTHFSMEIVQSINQAKHMGLSIPILWNSSAYESIKTLETLSEVVDIWLPDLKTLSTDVASRIYKRKDYPAIAREALEFMTQQSDCQYNPEGLMTRGTIIRHLILPGEMDSTRKILEWYSRTLHPQASISLLSQYTPVMIPEEKRSIPQRYLSQDEYNQVMHWLEEFRIDEGFIQELETGSDWLPDFREDRPFSAKLAQVIWKSGQPFPFDQP